MTQVLNNLAGKLAPPHLLIDVNNLIKCYYSEVPDPLIPEQRVTFGTSGHRGSSLKKSFNEHHILAITQAICLYRQQHHITGPLFLGRDTHALSEPALSTILEVLAANDVSVMLAAEHEYTPTPVISHAIITYNRNRDGGLADGIVITPSHNPPQDGGIKYNPPHGGPANSLVTQWIGSKANELLAAQLRPVKRISAEQALRAPTTQRYDFINSYISDLGNVINMELIRQARLNIGVDPLGGAGVQYWDRIADLYGLNLTVVNKTIDPTFRFMTVDWDGQIRMDPSSGPAMQTLINLRNDFDIAIACDTDHDRHGIVTPSTGLIPSNHFLAVAIDYLFRNRPHWKIGSAVGKTIVCTHMIDRITAKLGRKLYEVPVGFKWFVEGLEDGSLGLGGEESAGASFLRVNGEVWTTDKDGIVPALLSAEITAYYGRDPAEQYRELEKELGICAHTRIDAPATPELKKQLLAVHPHEIHMNELAGAPITSILTRAPGNDAPIDGFKVISKQGWFAVRPSGTEDIYKIYAESFQGGDHLNHIIQEAQTLIQTLRK